MNSQEISEEQHISVVIPAYNEQARIKDFIAKVADYFQRFSYRWEVVVVDDGSIDGTAAAVESLRKEIPQLQLVRHTTNQGKGAAVRTGLKASRGESILFCDADGATPIEEINKFLLSSQEGAAFIIGSRHLKESRVLVEQEWIRRWMGGIYRWLCRTFLTPNVSDITCGFKLLSRRTADLLIPRMRIHRWSFDAEMLAIARIHQLTVKEVPVHWSDQGKTKVRLFRDTTNSFCDLVRIWIYARLGIYR